ncbi:hypothetical protein IW137_000434 [Coemansia sp. RSA 1287]|nr:hypothetical protein IWW46_001901 [Coemansia sp. RSA 2440]KAJ2652018.1 hypothetical protein IW137_000434 [Coemansia sp. RSA 1287]
MAGDLVLAYIADIDQELVVIQGISAQITRGRQQNNPANRRPASSRSIPTHILIPEAIPTVSRTRLRKDNKNRSSAPPSIPLRMLLPKGQFQRMSVVQKVITPATSIPTPPMSPGCMSVNSRTSSINPRFSDAHIEYIGQDCVIHNGAQMVDIAMEFATQRAAPRLVSFPCSSLI